MEDYKEDAEDTLVKFTIKGKEVEILYNEDSNTYYFPKLYKKNKNGNVTYWSIEICEGTYTARTGVVDGKERVFEKTVSEGKGKCSVLEQAIFDARSKWNKKKDQKYDCEIRDTTGDLTMLRPMKAQSYDKYAKKISVPFAVSPKMDGIRALIFQQRRGEGNGGKGGKGGKEIIILSKLGKEYNFMNGLRKQAKKAIKRIQKTLKEKTGKKHKVVLDGELFMEDEKFDNIQSIVTSKKTIHQDEEKMMFWIFDLYIPSMSDMIYTDRIELLKEAVKDLQKLHLVGYEECKSKDEVDAKLDEYSKKYEGIMIRNLKSLYLPDYRSYDLQKYKKFFDSEFEIVDVTEGTGTHAGCIIYVCKTENGETFTVSPKQDLDTRQKLFEDEKYKEEIIGKMYTVRYQELTKKGIPRFPVGLRVRDYEEPTKEDVTEEEPTKEDMTDEDAMKGEPTTEEPTKKDCTA